jgi:hypothetical protein
MTINADGSAADSQVIAMTWYSTLSLSTSPILARQRQFITVWKT